MRKLFNRLEMLEKREEERKQFEEVRVHFEDAMRKEDKLRETQINIEEDLKQELIVHNDEETREVNFKLDTESSDSADSRSHSVDSQKEPHPEQKSLKLPSNDQSVSTQPVPIIKKQLED
jgi:hypothetical protein